MRVTLMTYSKKCTANKILVSKMTKSIIIYINVYTIVYDLNK